MAANQALSQLMAVFEKQKPDGTFVYTDDEVRHYLPYLVIAAKIPIDKLHPTVAELVGKFAGDAKLDMKAGAEAVQKQIEAYYEAKPFNAELHKSVMGFVRTTLASGNDEGRKAVEAMLGGATATGVLGGGVRPPGTVAGGILARLATVPPKK